MLVLRVINIDYNYFHITVCSSKVLLVTELIKKLSGMGV